MVRLEGAEAMLELEGWQIKHLNVMKDFLTYLYGNSDRFVLKGGTALMLCYGLNRFSEDIDLDGFGGSINTIVKNFCKATNLKCKVGKNTDTVKRFMLHYNDETPLKIEVSYRDKNIRDTVIIDGIITYNINRLCIMKLGAYSDRDKLRDLYDITFIGLSYWDTLNDTVKNVLFDSLQYKGLDHFDYIVRIQEDRLIDKNLLGESFLTLLNKFELV